MFLDVLHFLPPLGKSITCSEARHISLFKFLSLFRKVVLLYCIVMAKIIAVTGAAGIQGLLIHARVRGALLLTRFETGRSVAKLLLQFPDEYRVRVLTRNPDSDSAKDLQSLGAEVVRADLSDLLTLTTALRECWGVFGVINSYDIVCYFLTLGRTILM
jgi:hypothetical protein